VIKNVLWNVDGTLFDTCPAITYAISKSLNEMGLSIALNVVDGHIRQSLDCSLDTFSRRFKLDPDLLRQRFAKSYQTVDPANQPPFPGVREVCELIHQKGGLNLVVTHHSVQSLRTLLDYHGLAPVFQEIFSVEQGYPREPDPAMVLAALDKHNLRAAETLLIGNRDIDIRTGQAAGIHSCLFGQAELTAPPDVQIEHYDQLLTLLRKMNP
jgi:phosphoglycolate phosphatase-like HAD superfamily hydrolase